MCFGLTEQLSLATKQPLNVLDNDNVNMSFVAAQQGSLT